MQHGNESAGGGAIPRWYACYTRARHEKKVDRCLREQGFESYLPLIEAEHEWADRTKLVSLPVFPSYVFVRFDPEGVHEILTTPGVSTIVRIGARPATIPEAEIENVRRLEAALKETGGTIERRPLLQEGQRVRVVSGPFEGVEGFVLEARGAQRVLVGVWSIQQGLEVDIGVGRLEPIGGERIGQ